MESSMIGNILAIIFFLLFQMCGIVSIYHLLSNHQRALRILIGSVFGSVMLHWLPTLYAFLFGFNRTSNIAGLITAVLITGVIVYLRPVKKVAKVQKKQSFHISQIGIWFLIIPTFVFVFLILLSHTIQQKYGAIYTGQCTFGDMNLHLGIITSIANQGTFPPEYSIFPGTKLSYPFLADSISSSLYVFGCSLRLAYILPMLVALLQVFYGFYYFIYSWFHKKSKAIFAWILFFFNGGFGFFYFVEKCVKNPENFTRIFTEFYETPTNLVDSNIRWVNTIVDMLIPQRATLFGYAILFPVLALLLRAMMTNGKEKKQLFLLSGILISALPMIHTHSFLAIGVICAGWLLRDVIVHSNVKEGTARFLSFMPAIIVVYLIGMEWIRIKAVSDSDMLFFILACILVPLVIFLVYGFIRMGTMAKKRILNTWGVLLLIVLLLAFPQLFYWTFRQASEGNFLKGHFNWANEGDLYSVFYIKNLGIFALLIIPALLKKKWSSFSIAFPAFVLWIIAEFVVFQPNVYDNNKLLLPAFAILCGFVSDYAISVWGRIKEISIKTYVAIVMLVCATLSAFLTMGREYVSEYELYGADQLEVASYIEQNLPADAIILTDERHNNAISSLTGRNIVCGTPSFLYYHGIHYGEREKIVTAIYEDAVTNEHYIRELGIDYILISSYERSSYPSLNETSIEEIGTLIFSKSDVKLYKVRE